MKKYYRHLLLILICMLFGITERTSAQVSIKDSSISFVMLGASFQYQLPGGDMADRFYGNYNVGGFCQMKLKSNWLLGIEGQFLFSEKVKENHILDSISSFGGIITQDGSLAGLDEISFQQRGFMFLAKAGRLLPLFGPNDNSGLLLTAGVGLLQHKIRIETKENIPEISGEYKKGYDRLTNGLSLTESVSYMHCGNSRLINFSIGIECTQAFTQNRRDYNFDTMMKDDKKRIDLLFGAKFTWFFPIYKHAANTFYYN